MKTKETLKEEVPVHLFQHLQIRLAAMIANTPPGERLTAEPELAKQLGVSRATLREAMRSFEGQGLIRRRQGVGTFVIGHPPVIASGLEVLESIETLAGKMDLNVSMGDLQVRNVKADDLQARALNIEAGIPLVEIVRVIMTENRPVAYLIDVLPEDILTSEELKVGFTGSVLDLLLKRGQPSLSSSLAEIHAVAAPSEIARALEIQRGDVLLMFEAQLHSDSGRVIDHSLSYFIPGYFRFQVVRRVNTSIKG